MAPRVGVVSHAGSIFVFECRPWFLRFRESNTNGPILGGLTLAARLVKFANKDVFLLDFLQRPTSPRIAAVCSTSAGSKANFLKPVGWLFL